MEKAKLLPLSPGLQGRLQPDQLPVEDLRAVFSPFLLIKPAPGTAQSDIPVDVAVIVEDLQSGKPLVPAVSCS